VEGRRKKRDNCNDSSAVAAFLKCPLENQVVIKCNKTFVVDMLEWEKTLVAAFDLIIELKSKQKVKHEKINCFEAVLAIVSPERNDLFCLVTFLLFSLQ